MQDVNEIEEGRAALSSPSIKYPQLFDGLDLHDINKHLVAPVDVEPVIESFDLRTQLVTEVAKAQGLEAQPTNQSANVLLSQVVPPPVDVLAARKLKDISPHHASCIQSKKYSIMGLGFVSEATEIEESKAAADTTVDTETKIQTLLTGAAFIESEVDKNLDPLTMFGFMSLLYKITEDFLDAGTGYLEVVRDEDGKITGLNWLPYEDVDPVLVKDDSFKLRVIYKYKGNLLGGGQTRFYSLFGKENRQWVYDRYYAPFVESGGDSNTNPIGAGVVSISQVSEVIPFMMPSNRARYHGYPEWLSASAFVTLLSMALQYKSDFYTNKGVLAYILTVIGQVTGDKWKEIERLVQGSVGGGNNFKNLAIQISGEKSRVQVDKLASSDKTEMQFSSDSDVFAQSIVSAHRVPPVLANILIPGKLGASNEQVQAIVSFQLLVVGPMQKIFEQTLSRTLGGDEGVDGLKSEHFRLRTITSQFDILGLDTIGRAREEAVGSGRDFSEGVKD